MKNRRKYFWWGLLGFLLLVALCLLTSYLYSYAMDRRAFNSRPLVIIQSPFNHDQVPVGERVLVHANARADNGLSRLELWVDDALISTKEAPESHPTTLVLSSDWLATMEGIHVLVVRAVAANGIEGQASITVEALESGESGVASHIVQEGETLETIAASYGTTPGELEDLNPGLAPGGPAAGDDLVVPEGGSGGGDGEVPPETGEEEPAAGAEPPPAEAEPPHGEGIIEEFFLLPFLEVFTPEPAPLILHLEIPSLHTGGSYDGLHCYVELAGSPPQWYPDMDHDQSSDESFTPLGDGWWDSAAHLVGGNAPAIIWASGQPLPLVVSCVGVVGGMEALELGRVELSIPPEEWNGITHEVAVSGAEGQYNFTYRVSRQEGAPRGIPMYLDPGMTPPTNARLDDRRISLRWDYNPESDEEPIDGFRIYLNGNLQWVEPPDARESGLPYEWFNPPCGSTYTFGVTAYRIGYPDGPESLPAIAIKEQPLEGCTREIHIVFQTLETFDLGSDGHYEDRTGDVGPAYGYFYANEEQITFDGGDLGGGGLDLPIGLYHNTVYDLSEMSADPDWNFNGMNSTIVDVPPGGTFEFGFHIMNEDSGRCHDSDDPGCDNLICEGSSVLYDDTLGVFDRLHEGSITSDDGRCRLTYGWGPAFSSPVGSGEPGWEPLPWISVEDFTVDAETGKVEITVRNTGSATWPWKDLTIALQTRQGEILGEYTWPDFVLELGQQTTLEPPATVSPPFDVCVVIDPDDAVLEEYERTGALFHGPVCKQLPDLTITDVNYDPSGSGRVRVTVQNIGDGALESRTVGFDSTLADGSPAYLNRSWPEVNMEPGASRTFEITGVSETVRSRLVNGYSITVNPDTLFAETSLENNSYSVRGASRMWLRWCETIVPHYYGYGHTVRMDLTASTVSGASVNPVLSHHIEDYFSYIYIDDYDDHYVVGDRVPGRNCMTIGNFQIFGDQLLQIRIEGEYQSGNSGGWDDLGAGTSTFSPTDSWEADISPECDGWEYNFFDATSGWHDFAVFPHLAMANPPLWTATYHLCVLSGSEP